jgi:hypothetical protein
MMDGKNAMQNDMIKITRQNDFTTELWKSPCFSLGECELWPDHQ